MLERCARHQLREDSEMWQHLCERGGQQHTLRPNLMLRTGPAHLAPRWRREHVDEHGAVVAMLLLKAG